MSKPTAYVATRESIYVAIIRLMSRSIAAYFLLFCLTQSGTALDDKGNCPSPPESRVSSTAVPKRETPPTPLPAMHYIGSVAMELSLSDTGAICDVRVVKSLDVELDKQAVSALRKQLFQPIRVDDKPVSGFMIVFRDYWRGDTSDTLYSETADAAPEDIPPAEESTSIPGTLPVLMAGKIDGSTYRNEYFGISFTALGADMTISSLTDPRIPAVRLVSAISPSKNRAAISSIAVVADRTSNYPTLKAQHEYVDLFASKLRTAGATSVRETSPFLISNVQFMGAILREPDGTNTKEFHYRGFFSTPRRGYWLSFDITAATEQQVTKLASSIQLTEPIQSQPQ